MTGVISRWMRSTCSCAERHAGDERSDDRRQLRRCWRTPKHEREHDGEREQRRRPSARSAGSESKRRGPSRSPSTPRARGTGRATPATSITVPTETDSPVTMHHDGQDQQPEDVVGDRGAEHRSRLGGRQRPEVAEHARRDPDAGRGERGADEQRRVAVLARAPHRPARRERDDDTDDRHLHRARPTRPSSRRSISSPTSSRRRMTPSSARKCRTSLSPTTRFTPRGRRRCRPRSRRHALGTPRRSASSAPTFAASEDDQEVEQQARQVDGLDRPPAREPNYDDDRQTPTSANASGLQAPSSTADRHGRRRSPARDGPRRAPARSAGTFRSLSPACRWAARGR